MAGNYKKIYKSRSPAKIALAILIAIVVALIAAAVILYFGLKKYIVTDSSGLHLEVPFLAAESENETETEPEIIIER